MSDSSHENGNEPGHENGPEFDDRKSEEFYRYILGQIPDAFDALTREALAMAKRGVERGKAFDKWMAENPYHAAVILAAAGVATSGAINHFLVVPRAVKQAGLIYGLVKGAATGLAYPKARATTIFAYHWAKEKAADARETAKQAYADAAETAGFVKAGLGEAFDAAAVTAGKARKTATQAFGEMAGFAGDVFRAAQGRFHNMAEAARNNFG